MLCPHASPWLVNQATLLSQPLGHLHLKDFLNYEYELYIEQPLTPPQRKIIATCHVLNHGLAIAHGQ